MQITSGKSVVYPKTNVASASFTVDSWEVPQPQYYPELQDSGRTSDFSDPSAAEFAVKRVLIQQP